MKLILLSTALLLAIVQTHAAFSDLTDTLKRAALTVGSISLQDLEKVDFREIRMLLTDAVLQGIVATWSAGQKDELCMMMVKFGDVGTLRTLNAGGIDCRPLIESDTSINIRGGLARYFVQRMRDEQAVSAWDTPKWLAALRMSDGLHPGDIDAMTEASLRALLGSGAVGPGMLRVPRLKRALAKRLIAVLGAVDTWTATELNLLPVAIGLLDVKELRKIPAPMLRQALATFQDVQIDDPAKMALLERLMVEACQPDMADTWDSPKIIKCGMFILRRPDVLRQLDQGELMTALPTIVMRARSRSDRLLLARLLMRSPDFQTPGSVSAANVRLVASLIPVFGMQFVNQLTPANLEAAISQLGSANFKRGEAKAIVERIGNLLDTSTLTEAELEALGSLLAGLNDAQWDAIPAAVLAASVDAIGRVELPRRACRKVLKMMKEDDGQNLGPEVRNSDWLMQCVDPDQLSALSLADLGLDCFDPLDTGMAPSVTFSRAAARRISDKIRNDLGNPGPNNVKYNARCFKRWVEAGVVKGFNVQDFRNLPSDVELMAIAEGMRMAMCDMEDAEINELAMKVKAFLLPDDAAYTNLDPESIHQVGHLLGYLSDSELALIPSVNRPVLCEVLSQTCMLQRPMSEVYRLFSFCLSNTRRDSSDTVVNRTGVASLDQNDVGDLGMLICGIDTASVAKLNMDGLREAFANSGYCRFSNAVKQAFMNRALGLDENFHTSFENLVMAGNFLHFMPDAKLNAIDQAMLAEAMAAIEEQSQMRRMAIGKRRKVFPDEISPDDISSERGKRVTFARKALEAIQAAGNTLETPARRRRVVTGPTCQEVQAMGSDLIGISTESIAAMTDADFNDCAETFSQETDWTSAQATALTTKAKAAWGAVGTWTVDEVKRTGTWLQGLTAAEIATITVDNEAIAILGQYATFTAEQLTALFNLWKGLGGNSAAGITGSDLIEMEHVACGAPAADIGTFPVAAYSTASDSIGALTTCGSAQLAAYASHAKSAYGAVSTWTTTEVAAVGAIIGGVTAEELGSLTVDQTLVIAPQAMRQIPADTFAGMTVDQLSSLSVAQANVVSADQQEALDTDQLDALAEAGGVIKVDVEEEEEESKASFAAFSSLLFFCSFIFTRL